MKRNPLILTALALLATCAHADAVDDFAKREMARLRVPGLVIGIVREGQPLDTRAYGMADLELNVPTTKDNVFEIGSITKQFTAVLALMLMEEGKLSLDDPVSKHIPDAPKTWEKITVRHLLFQTSGLQEYVFVEGLGLLEDYDRKTFLTKMSPLPLDYEPGTAWSYSNTNYALLGPVLEKAGGKPYAELLKERILTPLGMDRSRMVDPAQIIPNRAHGYFSMGPEITRSPFSAPQQPLRRRAGFHRRGHGEVGRRPSGARSFSKPASYALLWAAAPLSSGRTHPYGMGWNLTSPWPGAPATSATAATLRASTRAQLLPGQGLSVIILGNTYPGGGEGMSRSRRGRGAVAQAGSPTSRPDRRQAHGDRARDHREARRQHDGRRLDGAGDRPRVRRPTARPKGPRPVRP